MSFECCVDCKKRHARFHSECEEYIEAVREHERRKEMIRKGKEHENVMDDLEWVRIHGRGK